MRLFIAISLSPEIRGALRKVQDEMFDRGVRGNFTPEANMHLTLAFIGDYPDPEPVLDALAEVEFTPFEISLDGIGSFGDLWWAGVKDSAPLEAVVRRVRRALAAHGIPFDKKRFSPHITLVRKAKNRMPGTPCTAISSMPMNARDDSMITVRLRPRYTPTTPLRKPAARLPMEWAESISPAAVSFSP